MKKYLFLIFLVLTFIGCNGSDNFNLYTLDSTTSKENVTLNKSNPIISDIITDTTLATKFTADTIFIEQIRYMVEFEVYQNHFTLNSTIMLKDEMNKFTFKLPVDSLFYFQIKDGDKLVEEFRSESFILTGSIGNWNINVNKKEIVKEKNVFLIVYNHMAP